MHLSGTEVFYEIRPSRRARRLGLTVYAGGRLVLTLPTRADLSKVPHFLKSHEAWIARAMRRYAGKKILPGGLRDYRVHKESAKMLAEERTAHFNRHYRFRVARISIRNNRSRWGSCSRKGNLSFNYKLVHLRAELQDYIVVHELAHLKYFDHSPAFWATVAQMLPEYKKLRRELRSFIH